MAGAIPPAPFIDMSHRSDPDPNAPESLHPSDRKESTATERLRALHAKATAKLHEKLHPSEKKDAESSKSMQDRLMYL
jgi:hypothetical protein